MMNEQAAIEFRDVYRHFGSKEVLRGLSLEVRKGEILALLGRNGSGKTTALRTLMGFLPPHHGETFLLGVESRRSSPEDRGRIGYVAEGHRLYPNMRVCDAIDFEGGTRPDFRKDFADEAVRRCALSFRSLIATLSRGQRAQLSLILAVSGKPEALIFDDPALGLDVVMRREFLDAMIDLLSDRGCAVLFSTHILNEVERIADRVAILHEGRLIVDATLVDLKKRVQRRSWTSLNGAAPPEVPEILKVSKRRQGFDLTLLDCNEASEAALRKNGASLSDPQGLPLEDLFLDLVTEKSPMGILPPSFGSSELLS